MVKSAEFFCRAGHCEPQMLPLCGCYCRSTLFFLFPAVSTPLSFAILGGVKPKWDLCSVTWKAMKSLLFLAKWKWSSLSRVWLFATPMNYTIHGILWARILEWVASPFSRGSSQPRDRTKVSLIAGRFFTSWATREALFSWPGEPFLAKGSL